MNYRIDIEDFRKIKFMSQNKLAEKLNISQGYLSEIEHKLKSPTLRMLYKIAEELDVCPRLLIKCTIECNECTKKYKCSCECEVNK